MSLLTSQVVYGIVYLHKMAFAKWSRHNAGSYIASVAIVAGDFNNEDEENRRNFSGCYQNGPYLHMKSCMACFTLNQHHVQIL